MNPPKLHLSSTASIYRYLKQFFEHKGFYETAKGKWVRQNIFSNLALMYAMKEYLHREVYKVQQNEEDPEDRRYFVAKHAANHLTKLIRADPSLHCAAKYAAEVPIKASVLRVWLRSVFNFIWQKNQKGFANQKHDAVEQRRKFIFDNKRREYNNLVWHHVSLEEIKLMSSHLHELALLSRRVNAETDLGDPASAELMHNIYVYEREESSSDGWITCGPRIPPLGDILSCVEVRPVRKLWWVEMHVDF
jgi:hypothetical protein